MVRSHTAVLVLLAALVAASADAAPRHVRRTPRTTTTQPRLCTEPPADETAATEPPVVHDALEGLGKLRLHPGRDGIDGVQGPPRPPCDDPH